jgi:transcriptional regulator with XRE-family HTH domain
MINERIKNLRQEKELTQTQLAKEIGVTQKQISKWELSVIEPNIYMLIKLANFFDVSIDYLVGRTTYP